MAEPGTPPIVGIVGGSGINDMETLEHIRWESVTTPFGGPSDQLLHGVIGGQPVVFLPRHGRGHRIPPSRINFRANIHAFKQAGVTEIISLSAAGSLREELPPGTFVIVDQFIDRTFAREKSFFDTGLAAHVSMADPVCRRLGDRLEASACALDIPLARGGTYLAMEGPQFSSRAESHLYRSWNCDVIGMTNMPEAKLAREAEMCYATVAMVTDYDCWHPVDAAVTVETVIKVLLDNADKGRALVGRLVPDLAGRAGACEAGCHTALDNAIITAPDARDAAVNERLGAIVARAFGDHSE